jgi:DNA topoisomerase-3
VYTLAKAKSKPYKRIKLSESTEAMIVKAFDNPIDADKNIHRVYAAQSRAIADFIVGANLTVYETRRSKEKGVKNVGRVQTPTLNMIYVREKAIEDFVPSSTYGIEADAVNKDGEVFTIKLRQDEPFKTEEEANAFISAFSGKSFKCAMYEAKEALEYAPNPYDTTSLQIDASRKYGYSATDTLNAMQALYQPEGGKAGYITYPRTDSKFLMEEKKGEDFFRRFKGIEHISRFSSLLKYKNLHDRYFNNKKVEDHDAIIITGVKPDGIKSEIQKNIYSMIALRMIALTYPPAKLLKIKAGFVDKDGNKWVSSGIKILEEGYLEVFPKEQGTFPPHMEKGEMFKLLEMRTREMKAKKPSRYTEGTLVQAMENCASLVTEKEDKIALAKGIGRSATRAPTIEGLKTKGYISVKKNQIYLEEKGRRLIETISVEEVKSPMLTANWEKQLDEIENAEEGDIAKAVEMTVRFIKNIENQVGEWVTRI